MTTLQKVNFILDCILADRFELTLLEAYKATRKEIVELRAYIEKELNGKKK